MVSYDCNEFYKLTDAMSKLLDEESPPAPSAAKVPAAAKVRPEAATRSEHNVIRRQKWREMTDKLMTDPLLSDILFHPPRYELEVRFCKSERRLHCCCPCDLPDNLPGIKITAPLVSQQGITRFLYLRQLGEALYGKENDDSNTYSLGGEEDRPMIGEATWMMYPNNHEIMGGVNYFTRWWDIEEDYKD